MSTAKNGRPTKVKPFSRTLYQHMTDPAGVAAVYHAFAISQVVMVGVIACFLPLELWGFFEYWRTTPTRKDLVMKRLRWSLMLNCLFVVVVESIVTFDALARGISLETCNVLAKLIACAYMFLLQKIKLVSKYSQDWGFNLLLWGMQYTLVLFIPGCIVLYGVVTEGKVSNEGRCMLVFPTWTFWSFSVANIALSTALIYLFASPLKRMVGTGLSTVQHELKSLYWRNLLASSFAVLFTSASVIIYGVMQHLANETLEDTYSAIGLLLMCWDSFVLAVCCRLTTFVWLPTRVRMCLRGEQDEAEEEAGESAAANLPNELGVA
ncbi:hypothetical protein BASA81_003752 [Batrachochytrium salamandrivorans]|nr:hypothetical protein BASA81_003752 [Batrachochytrium salamandrivorans]